MSKLQIVEFDCDRTCPLFERVDSCRFNRLFRMLGVRSVVNSHTVRVAVQFRSAAALAAAVEKLGGSVIGFGSHELYERNQATRERQRVDGFAFTLPGWSYPLIATDSGELAYDDYNGLWGDVADIETLKAEYAIGAAKAAADSIGWLTEPDGDSLKVYHPSGGYLIVDRSGSVDAFEFSGNGCHAASSELAVAMGKPVETIVKPEFYETAQLNQQADNQA